MYTFGCRHGKGGSKSNSEDSKHPGISSKQGNTQTSSSSHVGSGGDSSLAVPPTPSGIPAHLLHQGGMPGIPGPATAGGGLGRNSRLPDHQYASRVAGATVAGVGGSERAGVAAGKWLLVLRLLQVRVTEQPVVCCRQSHSQHTLHHKHGNDITHCLEMLVSVHYSFCWPFPGGGSCTIIPTVVVVYCCESMCHQLMVGSPCVAGSTLLQVLVCVPTAVDDGRALHHILLSAAGGASPRNQQTMLVSWRAGSRVVAAPGSGWCDADSGTAIK